MRPRLPEPVLTGMRATTGQSLAIRYDPRSNTLTFVEDDWFADGLRHGSVSPRAQVQVRPPASVIRLRPRRR